MMPFFVFSRPVEEIAGICGIVTRVKNGVATVEELRGLQYAELDFDKAKAPRPGQVILAVVRADMNLISAAEGAKTKQKAFFARAMCSAEEGAIRFPETDVLKEETVLFGRVKAVSGISYILECNEIQYRIFRYGQKMPAVGDRIVAVCGKYGRTMIEK